MRLLEANLFLSSGSLIHSTRFHLHKSTRETVFTRKILLWNLMKINHAKNSIVSY